MWIPKCVILGTSTTVQLILIDTVLLCGNTGSDQSETPLPGRSIGTRRQNYVQCVILTRWQGIIVLSPLKYRNHLL